MFRLPEENTIDWVAYKGQKLISCSSEGSKSSFRSLAGLVSAEDLPVHRRPSHYVLTWQRGEGAVWGLSYWGTNPISICRDTDRAWMGSLECSHVCSRIITFWNRTRCGKGKKIGAGGWGPAHSRYHIQAQTSEKSLQILNLNLVFQTIIIHVR